MKLLKLQGRKTRNYESRAIFYSFELTTIPNQGTFLRTLVLQNTWTTASAHRFVSSM